MTYAHAVIEMMDGGVSRTQVHKIMARGPINLIAAGEALAGMLNTQPMGDANLTFRLVGILLTYEDPIWPFEGNG